MSGVQRESMISWRISMEMMDERSEVAVAAAAVVVVVVVVVVR